MPEFRYEAIDGRGQAAHGIMEAATEAEVVSHLQRQGLLPMRAEPVGRALSLAWLLNAELGRSGLRAAELSGFTRELSIMLGAGQDLDRALRFLIETAPSARVRKVVEQLREVVRDGGALATALARMPASFSRLYVGMVRAGEAGGTLAPTLDRLALLLERQRALAATVTSALIYPAILLLAALGSVALLLTVVLPQFVPLFEQNGATLPTSTAMLIGAGNAVSAYGLYGLATLLLAGAGLRALLRQPAPHLWVSGATLRLPLIGRLARENLAARFTRTLGTLLVNGVPLIQALAIVRDALGNPAGVVAVDAATVSARGGAGLSRPLGASGIFPPRTIHLLRLGEETAQLGAMALRAAEIHEDSVRIGVQRLVALLVPAITIVMGAIIAGIVSSLLLAMLGLNDLAG